MRGLSTGTTTGGEHASRGRAASRLPWRPIAARRVPWGSRISRGRRGNDDARLVEGTADGELLDAAKRLAVQERNATVALLRALTEIDSRRLYLGEGCASMFTYCTQVLHLSEGGAYNRIEAFRAARRFPVIFDLLGQSALTLTAVRLLAPHLTPDNHAAVLESARHRSKREVEELVAALKPKPDAPTVLRRLATQPSPADSPSGSIPQRPSAPVSRPPSDTVRPDAPGVAAPPPPPPPRLAPLAPDRYRLQVTLSGATREKLCRAQALLRHAVPTADAAEIIDRALTLLVDHLERRRFAETSRPGVGQPPVPWSRHIPATVRRHVWRRDQGRCAFAGTEGRCRETSLVEFHHLEPYAVGGDATADNIELRCRAHNAHEARLFFGVDGAETAAEGCGAHEVSQRGL